MRHSEEPTSLGQSEIGHTRRAAHGTSEERNAHPHLDGSGEVAVVQNGIIENYRSLREELQGQGVVFKSETDTEVIPHLVGRQLTQFMAEGRKPRGALLTPLEIELNDAGVSGCSACLGF